MNYPMRKLFPSQVPVSLHHAFYRLPHLREMRRFGDAEGSLVWRRVLRAVDERRREQTCQPRIPIVAVGVLIV